MPGNNLQTRVTEKDMMWWFTFLNFFAFYPAMFMANNGPASKRFQFRIVGGSETNIETYPFMVSILKNGYHHCGGTIYAPDMVLTASHCVYDHSTWSKTGKLVPHPAKLLTVMMGSSYSKPHRAKGATLRNVSEIIGHTSFEFRAFQNDIALLKLSSPVTYSATIQPVKLTSKIPPEGTVCTAIGWGISKPIGEKEPITGTAELKLHKVDLPLLSLKQCQKWMRQATYQSICTYTEGKDACVGDSGGPLICSGYQAGITSYGVGCAVKERPGIFQRADIHHEWLRYEPEGTEPGGTEPGGTAKPSAGGLLLLPLLLAFHAVASRTRTAALSLQYYLH